MIVLIIFFSLLPLPAGIKGEEKGAERLKDHFLAYEDKALFDFTIEVMKDLSFTIFLDQIQAIVGLFDLQKPLYGILHEHPNQQSIDYPVAYDQNLLPFMFSK